MKKATIGRFFSYIRLWRVIYSFGMLYFSLREKLYSCLRHEPKKKRDDNITLFILNYLTLALTKFLVVKALPAFLTLYALTR